MFQTGHLYMTQGIAELMTTYRTLIVDCLQRHMRGDWGDICRDDVGLNEQAIKSGARLLSVYHPAVPEPTKILIITDGDDDDGVRHATTVMLAHEY